MIEVRHYDPQRDDPEAVARLNPFPPAWQAWLAAEYARSPFAPVNVLLALRDGVPVGIIHLFDAGLPWAILDGFYLRPEVRTLANARALGSAAEDVLRKRGVPFYLTFASNRLARGLRYCGLTALSGPKYAMLGRHLQE